MIKATHPDPAPVADPRTAAHPGWWTVLAVLATAWLGIPLFLPVAAALPWFFFRLRAGARGHRLGPTVRWAVAVWGTGLVAVALAGDRALRTIPLGAQSAAAAQAWVDGTGSAVPSLGALVAGTVLFAAAAVLSRGILGSVVLSGGLLISAAHASVVLSRSWNVLAAAPVAVPVWSWLLAAGMVLALEPLAAWGERRLYRVQRGVAVISRRRIFVVVGLIAAAWLARLVVAAPWSDLVRRATIP